MELLEYETHMQMIQGKLDELGEGRVALANQIGVDPTTVNRYLNCEVEAPYKNLKQIWDTLQKWEDQQRQPAAELMTEGFISTTLSETRQEAADKMLEGEFSQLPVRETEEGVVKGIVTDVDLMRVHDEEKPIEEVEYQHVIEVDRDADRRLIEKILEEGHPAVLVVDHGTSVGIITRADLLETASPTV